MAKKLTLGYLQSGSGNDTVTRSTILICNNISGCLCSFSAFFMPHFIFHACRQQCYSKIFLWSWMHCLTFILLQSRLAIKLIKCLILLVFISWLTINYDIGYWGHVCTSQCTCSSNGRGKNTFWRDFLVYGKKFWVAEIQWFCRLLHWPSQMQLCLLLRRFFMEKGTSKKRQS